MNLRDFCNKIEELLPHDVGMANDRLGLQLESGVENITGINVALEVNDSVIDECIEQNCNLLVVFHPLIFSPLLNIKESNRVGRLISKVIKNYIALISVHTSFDAYSKGTNYILAKKLGLEIEGFLDPDDKREEFGMGLITKSKKPISLDELLERCEMLFRSPLRYCKGKNSLITKIGLLAGSGSSYLDIAISKELDVFITSDISYHKFHAVEGKMALIDPGHYEMEQFVSAEISGLIRNEITINNSEIKVNTSKILTNPVKYFPNTKHYIENQKNYLK